MPSTGNRRAPISSPLTPHTRAPAASLPAQAARPAAAPPAADGKVFVTLNVGGHRFLTTAATLAAVGGSYFSKLAQQAAAAAAKGHNGSEYFVDRSGKVRCWGVWLGARARTRACMCAAGWERWQPKRGQCVCLGVCSPPAVTPR